MALFWTIVTFTFVFGVLALGGYAFLKIFGFGHWREQY
jgi:hypothetical protein